VSIGSFTAWPHLSTAPQSPWAPLLQTGASQAEIASWRETQHPTGRDFLLGQPLAVTVLMKARRGLAVRDDGPLLTDNDWLAALQAGFRRPVDETVAYPLGDARLVVRRELKRRRGGDLNCLRRGQRWRDRLLDEGLLGLGSLDDQLHTGQSGLALSSHSPTPALASASSAAI
jgi:hypothetical protein